MVETKKLGLGSVVSASVGLVIATSTLVSLGQGAGSIGVPFIFSMVIAMLLNMTSIASLSELNALMPDTTGGLAQYTLAGIGPLPTLVSMVGGYLISNVLSCGVEASIFSYAMAQTFGFIPLPSIGWSLIMTVVIMIVNLYGVDMFAKIQDLVSYLLLGSMAIMGIIGMIGIGTGKIVSQPMALNTDFSNIAASTATAFWLFIGAEYALPLSKDVKNAKKNVPLGMMLGLFVIFVVQSIMVFGFHNYIPWKQLASSPAPHLLYGTMLLGNVGKVWMTLVGALAVISTQNSTANGLARICEGMAKMNMLPQFFAKTNKHDVPYVGVISISAAIGIFAWMSDSSSDQISFFILVGSVFWMISYIFAHIDVLTLRHRYPKAPRSFKVPGGPIIPIIGIVGTSYMILHISNDVAERNMIWIVTAITFAVLAVYSAIWIKKKMRMPIFKSVPIEKVMAMENTMFYKIRKARGIWK